MNHDIEDLSLAVWRATSSLSSLYHHLPVDFVEMVFIQFMLDETSPYSAKVREQSLETLSEKAKNGVYRSLEHSKTTPIQFQVLKTTLHHALDTIAQQITTDVARIENCISNSDQISMRIEKYQRTHEIKNILEQRFISPWNALVYMLGKNRFNIPAANLDAFVNEVRVFIEERDNSLGLNIENAHVIGHNDVFIQRVHAAFNMALACEASVSEEDRAYASNKATNILEKYQVEAQERLSHRDTHDNQTTASQYAQRLNVKRKSFTVDKKFTI